jgi:hypothetical protein
MLTNTILSELLILQLYGHDNGHFVLVQIITLLQKLLFFFTNSIEYCIWESYSKAELEYSFDYVENNLNSQKPNCGYGISLANNDSWQAPSPWLAMLMPSPMNIVWYTIRSNYLFEVWT